MDDQSLIFIDKTAHVVMPSISIPLAFFVGFNCSVETSSLP